MITSELLMTMLQILMKIFKMMSQIATANFLKMSGAPVAKMSFPQMFNHLTKTGSIQKVHRSFEKRFLRKRKRKLPKALLSKIRSKRRKQVVVVKCQEVDPNLTIITRHQKILIKIWILIMIPSSVRLLKIPTMKKKIKKIRRKNRRHVPYSEKNCWAI